jgi:transcription antitermination factor NusG
MHWFIFECRNGHEHKAENELRSCGLQTLLPIGKAYRQRKRAGKSSALVTYPLWGGYIMGGGKQVPWPALRSRFENEHCALFGVLCLNKDNEPSPIGPRLLDEIRNRSWLADQSPFDIGDEIKVTEGPFVGRLGKLVDIDDSQAEIVLDMLGKSVRATFHPAHLEKVA